MKSQVFNPYLPSYEYIPDGEPRIFGDRLYLYGSHDRFGGTKYCENDYVCWSAPVADLSDWRYEGVIYRRTDHPEDSIHRRTCLYAPDVIQGLDGNYYLYYSMAESSIMSVAVCDTPAGSYRYLGDIHDKNGNIVGNRPNDFHQFDPSIFIDDDHRIYLYSGFAPQKNVDENGILYVGCHVTELEADMLTVKNGPALLIPKEWRQEEQAAYFEAPSMRKINSLYYFVYSAKATGLFYYFSRYPDRDFQFGGRIHSASDIGLNGFTVKTPAYPIGNIHGGLVCINGIYYIFSHRHTNNSSFQRQGIAEPISIDELGHITQVEATSCGLNGGPLRGAGTYPAYIACQLYRRTATAFDDASAPCITQDVPDITNPPVCDNPPIQYVHGINHCTVLTYKYFLMEKCISMVSICVRGIAKGTLHICVNDPENCIGIMTIDLNSREWLSLSAQTDIPVGKCSLFFIYEGTGCFDLQQFTLVP